MSTSPTTSSFSGQSQFAASLQQVITRAVGIASLPLNSAQATLNTLTGRQAAVQTLDADFSNLQSSIVSLQIALSFQSLSTSISDASVARATVGTSANAGTYSIHVDDLGAYSTALSNSGALPISNPTVDGISTTTPLTLNVDGALTTITPATSSLTDLASAINLQAGDKVQATVVNVGSTGSPDYRLSLAAVNLGALSIDLTDASNASVIAESHAGSLATYEVGGLSTPLTSSSRTVTLAPGLTVELLGTSISAEPATIAVSNDPSALASAFATFARVYNQAASDLAQHHGKNGGALQGDSVVTTISSVLQQLSGYSNGSPDTALANFGITVDSTGQLSVNNAAFTAAAQADFSGLVATLGGTNTGGFLQAATVALNGVEDFSTGSLKVEQNSLTQDVAAQNKSITDEQARIALLQKNLTEEIVKADAAISALESQLSYVNGLFYSITGNNNNPNSSSLG